ncbi:hypothetical protein B7494_g675 [Chlorociboria aeruginascens]|nr:hypothetical protein B7494_g675 [Chlorociboria aeruginascens]
MASQYQNSYPGDEVHSYSDLEAINLPTRHPEQVPEVYQAILKGGNPNTARLPDSATHNVICGVKRRIFLIALAIAVVILMAATLGGCLGGVLSKKESGSGGSGDPSQAVTFSPSQALLPTTSPTTSSSTTATSSLTTSLDAAQTLTGTSPDGISEILYRDCPSSNNTLLPITTAHNPQTFLFRKICGRHIVGIQPLTNYVNQFSTSLDVCITACGVYNSGASASNAQLCTGVCWRNGFLDDDHPGVCFGYAVAANTSEGGFPMDYGATGQICDSAVLIGTLG